MHWGNKVSLRGVRAVNDSTTAYVTDLGSTALSSKEQDSSSPELGTYDNTAQCQHKQNSPFIWNSAENRSLWQQKAKAKQILSQLRVAAEPMEALILSFQDLLFLSVQLISKQKLFRFAKPSLPGFRNILSLWSINVPLNIFIHLQDTLLHVWKKVTSFSSHEDPPISSKYNPIFGYNSSHLQSLKCFYQLSLVPARTRMCRNQYTQVPCWQRVGGKHAWPQQNGVWKSKIHLKNSTQEHNIFIAFVNLATKS